MKLRIRNVPILAIATAITLATSLTGKTRGEAPAGGLVMSPVVDEATQTKATAKGAALLAKAKWSTAQEKPPYEMAAVGQTLLGYGAPYKTVALDLQTGQIQWTSKSDGQVGNVATSALAPSDNGLEVVQPGSGELLLKRLANGTGEESIVWHYPIERPYPNAKPGIKEIDITPHATFAGEQVIADGESWWRGGGSPSVPYVVPMSIRSLDRKTGAQQWATKVDGGAAYISQPLAVAGKVYVTVDQSGAAIVNESIQPMKSPKSYVVALDVKDGKVVWSTPPIATRQFAPVIAGQLLLTGTDKGDVVAYDAQTGKEKWRTSLSADVKSVGTALETQALYGPILPRPANLLFVDKDQLLVPMRLRQDLSGLAAATNKTWILGAFATVDIQSGRQTGYFGGFSQVVMYPPDTTVLGVHGDTIFATVRNWCIMGINRKTLRLECFIPFVGPGATLSNDVLYLTAKSSNTDRALAKIYALPLAAWDELNGQSVKP